MQVYIDVEKAEPPVGYLEKPRGNPAAPVTDIFKIFEPLANLVLGHAHGAALPIAAIHSLRLREALERIEHMVQPPEACGVAPDQMRAGAFVYPAFGRITRHALAKLQDLA